MYKGVKRLRLLKFWQVATAVIVLAGAGTGGYFGVDALLNKSDTAASTTSVQYATVGYSNLSVALTMSGSLAYYNTQQITFGASGTIATVKVAAGDVVAKGAILATFDDASNRSLQKALLQAQAALVTAQTALDTAEHPYSDADIATAEAAVTSAQIAVNTAQTNLDNAKTPYSNAEIAQAKLAVTNAKIALETAQTNLDDAEVTDDEIAAAEKALEAAQTDFYSIQVSLQSAVSAAAIAVNNATTAYQDALLHGTTAEQTSAYNALQAANAALTQARSSADKQYTTAQDAVTAAQDALDALLNPDPLVLEQKQEQLLIAKLNVTTAETTLAKMQATPDALNILQKEQQLAIAKYNLTKARETLADMKATPDATSVKLAQLVVENAQDALALAQQQAEYNAIIAPISGLITTVNIKAGSTIAASTVAIEMIDPTVFGLTASVSELDIASVALGQTAEVTMDALSGQTFTGKVAAISSTATTSQGVVSYKVTVTVDDPSGSALKSGMSASADITVKSVTHVLVVPNKAIGGTTTNPTVDVLVDGVLQKIEVTTGLSDDSYTQITSGLSEGDQVAIVSTVKASTTRTTTTKTTTTATTAVPVMTGGFQSGGTMPTDFPGGGSMPTGIPSGGSFGG